VAFPTVHPIGPSRMARAAASLGAPLATQVADRWHSVAQPGRSGRACRRTPPLLPAGTTPATRSRPPAQDTPPPPEAILAARTRVRHADIHTALARGLTITEISRTLRLERKTLRSYATAATADHLISGPA
jgi:DNA-binding NarL/FixJ family response regulator